MFFEIEPRVIVTGQHRGLLDQVLDTFQIAPDHDLRVMTPGQSLCRTSSKILAALEPVVQRERPDLIVVQGDTLTTLCGAMAGFYLRVPVVHVEAGLRTHDLDHPFPEEMNRVLTTRFSRLHLAPTEWARRNLLDERIPEAAIQVTGNTGIDALLYIRDGLESGTIEAPRLPNLDPGRKLIVVTTHRRENFGERLERICGALKRLAGRNDVELAIPVYPNPNVRSVVERRLPGLANIHLLPPLEYLPFVDLMRRAYFLITDSGGIQEEAPSLGKPVLVLRDKTERPEAVEAGTARLVGADPERIEAEATLLLDDPDEYRRRAVLHNPYGDGQAAGRCLAAMRDFVV